jgi:F-type H+-transporting ATPase subunit delta
LSANAIARRYAKALVQLASEEGAVAKFQADLTGFDEVLAKNPEVKGIFTSPAYGIEAKKGVMCDLIAKLSLPTTVANFLQLLLERNRLALLTQIVACYGALADELSGVVRPVLVSAFPLADSQVADVKAALVRSTGKQVELSVEIDPSLIGGVVTKIGDKVFDGSVKTQLGRIQDILQKG